MYPKKRKRAERFMGTSTETMIVNRTIDQFTKELKERTELEKLAKKIETFTGNWAIANRIAQAIQDHILEGLGDKK